jgi:nicotinate-nucleotide adenylyltransferase
MIMKINLDINLGKHEVPHIGLQFGSYNPPHLGHVQTAENLKEAGGLSAVFMMPITQSPYKKVIEQVPFEEKFKICQILADPYKDWLKVSDVCGHFPNTTIGQLQQYKRTIEALLDENPHAKFSIVAGEDFSKKYHEVAAGMAYLGMIAKTCKNMSIFNFQMLNNFVDRAIRASEVFQNLGVLSTQRATIPVEAPDGKIIRQEISSKDIRQAIISGADRLVGLPEPVLDHIKRRGLYSVPHP